MTLALKHSIDGDASYEFRLDVLSISAESQSDLKYFLQDLDRKSMTLPKTLVALSTNVQLGHQIHFLVTPI